MAATKEGMIAALKEAKKKIQEEYTAYGNKPCICLNLPSNDSGYHLRDVIEEAMGRCEYAESWLNRKGIDPGLINPKNMFKYRIRWINHMIKQINIGEIRPDSVDIQHVQ